MSSLTSLADYADRRHSWLMKQRGIADNEAACKYLSGYHEPSERRLPEAIDVGGPARIQELKKLCGVKHG